MVSPVAIWEYVVLKNFQKRLISIFTWNCVKLTLVLRTVLNTAPGFVASKFVPNLIPQWVDDEFIAEFRNVFSAKMR